MTENARMREQEKHEMRVKEQNRLEKEAMREAESKKYTSSLSPDVVFRDVQMRDDPMRPDFLTSLIDDMITYIDKRFQNFNEVPLSTFRALGLPDGAK